MSWVEPQAIQDQMTKHKILELCATTLDQGLFILYIHFFLMIQLIIFKFNTRVYKIVHNIFVAGI